MTIRLRPQPLSQASFARFGDVIEAAHRDRTTINQGFAERFNDLAKIDTANDGGETTISIARGTPQPSPISLKLVERHPLGSQIFYPLQDEDWLIVVSEPGDHPTPASLRAFRASGRQGINFARNVWHHPLLMPSTGAQFLIIDRKGPGKNLEEHWFAENERPILEA